MSDTRWRLESRSHILSGSAFDDTTPPIIIPAVSGLLGPNGRYRGDVSLTWDVQDTESAISSSAGCDPVASSSAGASRDPLLRSGLALARANIRGKTDPDDGVLTALEASRLNLWGTRLVALSACDTGVGEVRNGDGVYGLRRAFVLAGAESLLMSLWPVSDTWTERQMRSYYQHLELGKGRGKSLRLVCSSTCWHATPASIPSTGPTSSSLATGRPSIAPAPDRAERPSTRRPRA